MVFEPSAEDVDQFVNIVSCPKEIAIKWLKNSNNIVASAVETYFDREGVLPSQPEITWDDGAFHTDKTQYGPQNQPQNSFTVHSQDTLNPGIFDGIISRPPSRVSTHGTNNNVAGQKKQLTRDEQEDEDLQKAMAMSMNHSVEVQELGVTGSSGVHFGPANNSSYYETSKWAMTATGHHAQEILQNPEPEFRKRDDTVPAFIKPSPAGHYLSALITILHEIPVAREALLARDILLPDYGTENEWWDGVPILTPKVVDLEKEIEDNSSQEMISEPQRLMAFLDHTERAYGSTDILANLEGIRNVSTRDVEGTFLNQWQTAISKEAPDFVLEEIFESSAVLGLQTNPFHCLVLPLDDEVLDCGMTLYDAIDNSLWAGHSDDSSEVVYLGKVADVLVISPHRWTRKDGDAGLGIRIPPVWYADRYLEGAIEASKEMRVQKEGLTKDIKKIEQAQSHMTRFEGSEVGVKVLDPEKLLDLVTSHIGQVHYHDSLTNGVDVQDEATQVDDHSRVDATVTSQLKAAIERIAEKFRALEVSKEKARQQMRELSKLHAQHSDEENDPPHCRYTLRGVSTNPETIYVLARPHKEEDLMETESNEWQWWKIAYSPGATRPISHTKLREIEVLKAAKDDAEQALLVYASDRAIAYEGEELPPQLMNFVRADNLAFAAELEKATLPKPPTPPKRKAEDDYGDLTSDTQPNWGGFRDETPPAASSEYVMPPPPFIHARSNPPPFPPRVSTIHNDVNARMNYDDTIPMSLVSEDATVNPSNLSFSNVDLLGEDESVQRMAQTRNVIGVVPGGTGVGMGEYALGDYQPEIEMDVVEDEVMEKAKAD